MSEYLLPEFEREWIEFLNELRTALPGVQLLFGFLLAVPFAQGFQQLGTAGRFVYLLCFLATTAACAFLIAPSIYHRLHWRREIQDKKEMLLICNRLAITGSVLLAFAMTAAVLCVVSFLYPLPLAIAVTALAAGAFTWLWFGLPLRRRRKERAA